MRVHHLNCGTMCPVGGHLMDGRTPGVGPATLVCHCLLIEASEGLILVDTGLGTQDIARPRERMGPALAAMLRVQLRQEDTALAAVEGLGFARQDVRHVVLTHLDFDHAGGIDDFPMARIHLLGREARAAHRRDTPLARQRYRPRQWIHPDETGSWQLYDAAAGEPWFGFQAVRELVGLPPEVLLIPLPGHTWGHAAVAVQTEGRWLLHAGDAYFYAGEMDVRDPRVTPGLAAYQWLMEVDRRARRSNQRRLRGLVAEHGDAVRVFCAHDAAELAALQEMSGRVRQPSAPAEHATAPPP
jgi:glyoxylase-like metal-dependent hydrolase (beta-lactamase superfamily II)